MIPTLYPLPYDPVGNLVGNYRSEIVDLDNQFAVDNKVIALNLGYFYKHDLIVSYENGKEIPSHKYRVTSGSSELTLETSLENAGILVIQGALEHTTIRVTARMVGGKYCNFNRVIVDKVSNLMNNSRVVHYNNIKGLPDAFPTSGHLHALWQLYGFTPSVKALKRITDSFETMPGKDFDRLWEYIDVRFGSVRDRVDEIESLLTDHINNSDNPHRLTATQVDLGKVIDAPIATDQEAILKNGNLLRTYATPRSLDLSLKSNFLEDLLFHIDNYNNPHRNNANDMGTYNTGQLDDLNNLYYERGDTVNATQRISGTKDVNNETLTIGETFQELYIRARTGMNASEIKSGVLPIGNLTVDPKKPNCVLVATSSNTVKWRTIDDIWAKLAPKPVMVFHVATNAPNGETAGWLNTNLPPHTVGENSIAVFRQTNYGTSWQNGTHYTYFTSFGMATMYGGTWRE